VSTINEPDTALQRLHVVMRDKDDPEDEGLMRDLGAEILRVSDLCGEYVEKTGKAFKGSVNATFEIHASPDGKMVEIEVTLQPMKTKTPEKTPVRKSRFWRGSDGELSTVPVQKDQMTFPALRPVDGGKQENAPKGAVKAV
jgi:hypothetical protein